MAPSLTGCGDSLAMFPHVLEFISACVWPDASARSPGTVTLFTQDGRWKIVLNDKNTGECCFVSGETLDEAFVSAESVLEGGGGDWRAPTSKRR